MGEEEVQEFLEDLRAMRGLMKNLVRLQRKVPNSERVIMELMKVSLSIKNIEDSLEPVAKF